MTASKRRGGNLNEIIVFFSYQCSAFIQGVLALAKAGGRRSTFYVYLVSSSKKKKQAVFLLTQLPVSSECWSESLIVQMVARAGQPAI